MHTIFVSALVSIFCLVSGVKYRLSTDVKPSCYSIRLYPDLDKETFSGKVSIRMKIESCVESIEFHSSHLNITSVYLNMEKVHFMEGLDHYNVTFGYSFVDHELVSIVHPDGTLIKPGEYTVHIKYHGEFSKNGTGFFKTKFTKKNKTLSYLAATDFEPSHARRVFPCFDEPAFKARFKLILVAPNHTYSAISNMREIERRNESQGVAYTFETTPLMSTYLVAFAISPYSYGELTGFGNIPIRVYSHNASNENNKQVMKFAEKALKYYTEYTEYSYPLPKIDMIEYDRSLNTATENWGLITLNTGLLSPKNRVYDKSQRVGVIAHELAHYWFGNLVTNAWWDDIWLQEGFAVYMALKVEEEILKNNATRLFQTQHLDEIFSIDQNHASKPIVNYVLSPTEVEKNFNDITYTKGAVLLQMIEMVLGKESFRRVIINYVCCYAFKTATSKDFVEILENINPNNIHLRDFVESYLYQNRFPIVHVEEDEVNNVYILKQSSCGYQNNDTWSPFGYKWTIPITYITSLDANQQKLVWFDKDVKNLTIPKGNETWIKFNYQQIGFYHVNYSTSLWEKLFTYNREMDAFDRNHLLLEALRLFDNNIVSCDVALRYLEQLSNVTDTSQLNLEYTFIVYIKMRRIEIYDKDAHELLVNFFQKILTNAGRENIATKLRNGTFDHPADVAKKQKGADKENIRLCIDWIKKKLSS